VTSIAFWRNNPRKAYSIGLLTKRDSVVKLIRFQLYSRGSLWWKKG